MDKCIMCGKEVFSYPGYITDGKIVVCGECAGINSLTRIVTRISNMGIDANLVNVFSDVIDVTADSGESGYDQTTDDNSVETDGNQLFDDIMNMSQDDFYSKYADNPDALNAYHDANGEPDDNVSLDDFYRDKINGEPNELV